MGEWWIEAIVFLSGLIIGSFLNMLIYRLPRSISLVNPKRSICPKCKGTIKWYENIPIVSFLLLKGKCSNCAQSISLQYPAVEFITALSTLLLYNKLGMGIELIIISLFCYTIIMLSFIDIEYKAVPDYLLIISLALALIVPGASFVTALEFAGAFVILEIFVTFYIQNIKYRLTKNEALRDQKSLGEGDIPIIAALGAILGLKAGLVAIALSAVFAIIPSVYSNMVKKEMEIPFIPFLSLGLFCEYIFDISSKVLP
jgi:leader peptidase (prepilin peptidase)/N-methyltransferase